MCPKSQTLLLGCFILYFELGYYSFSQKSLIFSKTLEKSSVLTSRMGIGSLMRFWLTILFYCVMVLESSLKAQVIVTRTWTGTVDNSFINALNWDPQGAPDGNDIVIPQTNRDPVLSTPITIHTLLMADTLNITLLGALTTVDSVRVQQNGRVEINSTGIFTFGGKLIIDSNGIVHIATNVNISNIADDINVKGTLIIDAGVVALVTCNGSWIRGPGSSFTPGNSKFTFTNPIRAISIDRATFYDLVIGTALADTIVGNITINNRLTLANPVAVLPADTLFIANADTSAILDTTGTFKITRGAIRRAIDSTVTTHYRFHHKDVTVKFYAGSTSRPQFVTLVEFPDSLPKPSAPVHRFYTIEGEGGGAFFAELVLHYEQSEIGFGVDESQLGLERSTDDGVTWVYVGGTVDTANNFVRKDTINAFSKWSYGTPSNPLPIQLASFDGSVTNGSNVLLEWTTTSEVNNYGFYAERRRDNEVTFMEIPHSFIPGHGTTLERQYYSFVDSTITLPGTYHYRLRQHDLDGSIHYSHSISIHTEVTFVQGVSPHEFRLFQNYPNPFNPSTEIQFSIATTSRVILVIYNVLGQIVQTLVDQELEAGIYLARWDAKDLYGQNVSSGLYIYKITASPYNPHERGFQEVRKMMLMK